MKHRLLLCILCFAQNLIAKPNVVLFFIDDMGWRDVGFMGNRFVETPTLDALAQRGVVFTQAYASAPNCAPSRACLMSGQYTPRHGVYTVVDERHAPGSAHHKMLAATSHASMATETITLAEQLQANGYRTAMFGMWNLGRGRLGPTTPTGQGFEIFKQPKDLNFEKDRYFNDAGDYLSDRFTDESIDYIHAHQDEPFFVYLALHAVHAPFEAKPELAAKYTAKAKRSDDPFAQARDAVAMAATIEAVDQNVERVVEALDQLGLSNNTVIIFTSDNGGNRQFVAPLNGGKGSLYEGGVRVPALAVGPGISPGVSSAIPVLGMDWYPTILDLAGIEPASEHHLDGESLRPLLQGNGTLNRETVFWHFPCYIGGGGPSSSIRKGDWKLIQFFEGPRVELYNLADDPSERDNLAEQHSEKTVELFNDLTTWQTATGAVLVTQANPNYDPNATRKKGRDQRGKGKQKK